MKARYRYNGTDSQDNRYFRIMEPGCTLEGSCRFSLASSNREQFLHPEGWKNAEYLFSPEDVIADGKDILLVPDSALLSSLESGHTYQLTVFPAEGDPMQILLECEHSQTSEPGLLPPLDFKSEQDAESGPYLSLAQADTKSASLKLFVPLILLALLLAAGGYWYMHTGDLETGSSAPWGEPGAPGVLAPLERARAFLRAPGSADDAVALSRTMPVTQEGRDASFILLEWAAEQSQPEAMLLTAHFYDPLDAGPKGSIIPDVEQAWIWYSKAGQTGLDEAHTRLAALRQAVENEAVASRQARETLERLLIYRP